MTNGADDRLARSINPRRDPCVATVVVTELVSEDGPHLGDGQHRQERPRQRRMPEEKRNQRCFPAFKKAAQHEREKPAKQQEDDDEYVCNRRGEIAAQFTFRYGSNIRPTVHFFSSCVV